MEHEWKDATSYPQGQRGKVQPTGWETSVGGFRVWVSKGHLYYPDLWVMNAAGLNIKELVVGPSSIPAEEAQVLALRMLRTHAEAQIEKMHRLIADIGKV